MTEHAHRAVVGAPRRRDLLVRLAAVEKALQTLEHEVRDVVVESRPANGWELAVRLPSGSIFRSDECAFDPLVIEIAA